MEESELKNDFDIDFYQKDEKRKNEISTVAFKE